MRKRSVHHLWPWLTAGILVSVLILHRAPPWGPMRDPTLPSMIVIALMILWGFAAPRE